eukprot:Hpha_TRINITY_DN14590_c0_g1::TRINITY_DN14590_c0_g1_i1::g.47278::m.47278
MPFVTHNPSSDRPGRYFRQGRLPGMRWNQSLDDGLIEFYSFLAPMRAERRQVGLIGSLIMQVVNELSPSASVRLVGSRAIGVSLPSSGADFAVEGWRGGRNEVAELCRRILSRASGLKGGVVEEGVLAFEYEPAGSPGTTTKGYVILRQGRFDDTLEMDEAGRAVALAMRVRARQSGVRGLKGHEAVGMVQPCLERMGKGSPRSPGELLFSVLEDSKKASANGPTTPQQIALGHALHQLHLAARERLGKGRKEGMLGAIVGGKGVGPVDFDARVQAKEKEAEEAESEDLERSNIEGEDSSDDGDGPPSLADDECDWDNDDFP